MLRPFRVTVLYGLHLAVEDLIVADEGYRASEGGASLDGAEAEGGEVDQGVF